MSGLSRHIFAGAGGAAVVVMAALSAPAQNASPYTMPVNPPLDSRASGSSVADQVRVPVRADLPEAGDAMSAPAPTPLPPVDLSQTPEKERKNWTEMTPEEIWGLPPVKKQPAAATPAESFDPSKHSSPGSPLADFLTEQRRANGHGENSDGSGTETSFWGVGAIGADSRHIGMSRDRSMPGALLTQLLQTTRTTISGQDYSSEWAGVLQTPQAPAPTLRQQADIEAFREMLNPSLAPENLKNTSFQNDSLKTPGTDPDVEPASTKYHPNGSTYAPLDSGIGRPKRLDPLPTATSAGSLAPATRPAWAPQPPPWTITAPQLFIQPQRHF